MQDYIDRLELELTRAARIEAGRGPALRLMRSTGVAPNYDARSRRVRSRVAVGALAGLAGTASAVFVIVGPGTANAFAGWSARPTAASTATGEAACAAAFAPQAPPSAPVVLTDVRGPWTLAIAADGSTTVSCWTGPSVAGGFVTDAGSQAPLVTPPAGQVELAVAAGHQTPDGGAPYQLVTGRAGAGVSAIALVLANGTQVQATTANGWFAAWWPGTENATTAEVTTTTGVSTQQLNGLPSGATATTTTTTP
jgi:hypothetical protein